MANPIWTPNSRKIGKRASKDVELVIREYQHFTEDTELQDVTKILDWTAQTILSRYKPGSRRAFVNHLIQHFRCHGALVPHITALEAMRRTERPTRSRLDMVNESRSERCRILNSVLGYFGHTFNFFSQFMQTALWATTALNLPVMEWPNVEWLKEENRILVWKHAVDSKKSRVFRVIQLEEWPEVEIQLLSYALALRSRYFDYLRDSWGSLEVYGLVKLAKQDIKRLLFGASRQEKTHRNPNFLQPLLRLNLATTDGSKHFAYSLYRYRCLEGAPDRLRYFVLFRFQLIGIATPTDWSAERYMSGAQTKYLTEPFFMTSALPTILVDADWTHSIERTPPYRL